MKLATAIGVLVREVEFLGYKNLGQLVDDVQANPLAYPLRTLAAYRVYRELARV
jgi:hypothetical protein